MKEFDLKSHSWPWTYLFRAIADLPRALLTACNLHVLLVPCFSKKGTLICFSRSRFSLFFFIVYHWNIYHVKLSLLHRHEDWLRNAFFSHDSSTWRQAESNETLRRERYHFSHVVLRHILDHRVSWNMFYPPDLNQKICPNGYPTNSAYSVKWWSSDHDNTFHLISFRSFATLGVAFRVRFYCPISSSVSPAVTTTPMHICSNAYSNQAVAPQSKLLGRFSVEWMLFPIHGYGWAFKREWTTINLVFLLYSDGSLCRVKIMWDL